MKQTYNIGDSIAEFKNLRFVNEYKVPSMIPGYEPPTTRLYAYRDKDVDAFVRFAPNPNKPGEWYVTDIMNYATGKALVSLETMMNESK